MLKTSEVPKPRNHPNCHKVFTSNWSSFLFSFCFLSLGLGPVLICREKSRRSTNSLGFRSETPTSLHHVSLLEMGLLKCQRGGEHPDKSPRVSRCLFASRASHSSLHLCPASSHSQKGTRTPKAALSFPRESQSSSVGGNHSSCSLRKPPAFKWVRESSEVHTSLL